MKKTAVVNFANNVGRYIQMQQRLKQSLEKTGFDGDIFLYNHEEHITPSCPYHKSEDQHLHAIGRVVPYAFKAYALQEIINKGYENVIWMDAAIYASKSIQPFIDEIEKTGYAFFDNIGFTVGDYTSDRCLEKHGWTREKAFDSKMIMACVFGLNTKSKEAMEFFTKYKHAADDKVSYIGSWHNHNGEVSSDLRVQGHRHDQSVASMIIKDMNLNILNAQQTYFAYTSHKGILPISESVCLWSQGI
jgi:hypothetical protein